METIRVKKGNKEKKIDRDHLDSYLSSGYIQLDENGNEIKQVKKDNPEISILKDEVQSLQKTSTALSEEKKLLEKQIKELEAELKSLTDENKALKKQLKELEKADKKEQ